jgi:hypothetical protein
MHLRIIIWCHIISYRIYVEASFASVDFLTTLMQLNPLNVDSDLLKIQPPVLTEFLQFEIHLIISGNLSCFVVFVVRPSGGELLQLATRRVWSRGQRTWFFRTEMFVNPPAPVLMKIMGETRTTTPIQLFKSFWGDCRFSKVAAAARIKGFKNYQMTS